MVPLALANVLVNNLLAREQFRIVPWLVAVAAAYGFALTQFHDSFLTVIKTIGVFTLVFLGVAVWFTWRKQK
jgi:threonine/homoserine/homoserine lactone efflux protein